MTLADFLNDQLERATIRKADRQYKDHWSDIDRREDNYDLQLILSISKWLNEINTLRVDSMGRQYDAING